MKLYVFIFFLLIYLASNGGHIDNYDGNSYYLLTENLVLHHSLKVQNDLPSAKEIHVNMTRLFLNQEQIQNGNHAIAVSSSAYFTAPPLLSYLSTPFYLLSVLIHAPPQQIVPYLVNSVILAFTATVIFAFCIELYQSKKVAFIITLLAGVCSFAWPYVSTFFLQPLSGLMIISSLYFLFLSSKNKFQLSPFFGGLFLSLITLAHSSMIISSIGILFYAAYTCEKKKKKWIYFIVGFIPLLLVQCYLNLIRFGSITNFGYGEYQSLTLHSFTDGLWGLFFSSGFGLLTNFPVFILFFVSTYYLWKKNRSLTLIILYLFISAWLFFGTLQSPIWHGFGAWGPRYLEPIVPIIAVSLSAIVKEYLHKRIMKASLIVLGAIGFFINLLGVLVWWGLGTTYGWTLLRHFTTIEYESLYYEWVPQFMPAALNWGVLATNYWDSVTNKIQYAYWGGCIPDNFIYCNFGFAPLFGFFLAISFSGFLILKKIRSN